MVVSKVKQPLTSLCHSHSGLESEVKDIKRHLTRLEKILWGLVGVAGAGALGGAESVRALISILSGGNQ